MENVPWAQIILLGIARAGATYPVFRDALLPMMQDAPGGHKLGKGADSRGRVCHYVPISI